VFDDLVAEQYRLETILSEMTDEAWLAASGADGWTVCDVVLHLA
jgi:Mycothiol maleylpyruvate isomerase N-terminal domain